MKNFIDPWVRFASNEEIKKQCEDRRIHQSGVITPAIIYGELPMEDFFALTPSKYINPNNNTEYDVRKSCWDTKFKLTSVSEIKRFLKWNNVDMEPYTKDVYDCNSFAVSLWGEARKWTNGLALGLILVPGHAKNFFFDERKILWSIEPQSDVVTPIEKHISHFFI